MDKLLSLNKPELFDFDKQFLFQEILTNLFQPLFEVTKDPSSHPALHR